MLWTRPGLDLKTKALICVLSDSASRTEGGRYSRKDAISLAESPRRSETPVLPAFPEMDRAARAQRAWQCRRHTQISALVLRSSPGRVHSMPNTASRA